MTRKLKVINAQIAKRVIERVKEEVKAGTFSTLTSKTVCIYTIHDCFVFNPILREFVIKTYKETMIELLVDKDPFKEFLLKNFRTSFRENSISIDMPGDFCTNEKFQQLHVLCLKNKTTKISKSRLQSYHYVNSLNQLRNSVEEGDANLVVSVSEDYINKLLVTTYDAGLWKESLDEAGVELGPNKVILRLDQRGDSGTLILDVIYKPTKFEKNLIGSKIIRFPLVLDISLRIEKIDEEAVVIIKLNSVDSSDDTLINGRPDLNILSNIKDIPRFKTKVAKKIRERLVG